MRRLNLASLAWVTIVPAVLVVLSERHLWGEAMARQALQMALALPLAYIVVAFALASRNRKPRNLLYTYTALGALVFAGMRPVVMDYIEDGAYYDPAMFEGRFYSILTSPVRYLLPIGALVILAFALRMAMRTQTGDRRWAVAGLLAFAGLALFPLEPFSIYIASARCGLVLLLWMMGAWLSKHRGFETSIMAAVCVPTWLVFPSDLLSTVFAVWQTNGDSLVTQLAVAAWAGLPALCFLVIIPIGVMRAGTDAQRIRWLLIPSAVTLLVLYVLREVAVFGANPPLDWLVFAWLPVLLAYLPLVLAALVYERGVEPAETAAPA